MHESQLPIMEELQYSPQALLQSSTDVKSFPFTGDCQKLSLYGVLSKQKGKIKLRELSAGAHGSPGNAFKRHQSGGCAQQRERCDERAKAIGLGIPFFTYSQPFYCWGCNVMEQPQLSCILLVLVAISFGIQYVNSFPMIEYQVGDQLRFNPGYWLFYISGWLQANWRIWFVLYSQTSFGASVIDSDASWFARKPAPLWKDDENSGYKNWIKQNEATKNRSLFLAIEVILTELGKWPCNIFTWNSVINQGRM